MDIAIITAGKESWAFILKKCDYLAKVNDTFKDGSRTIASMKIAPNPKANTNPNPSPNPNRGQFSLGAIVRIPFKNGIML